MNMKDLRKWHRRGAFALAPFLLLQSFSGLFLSFGLYSRLASLLKEHAPPTVEDAWTLLMARLHLGPRMPVSIYHVLLFLGVIWVIFSGLMIWAERRKRLKASQKSKRGNTS